MQPKISQSKRRTGFTLSELLVVILIIATLASLLFALTSRMRNAARTTTCLSNQRQLISGIIEWVQNNNGSLPQYVRARGFGGFYWFADMSYAEDSSGGNTLPAAPHKPLHPGETPGIWVCPANDPFKNKSTNRCISYSYNSKCFSTSADHPAKLMQMSDPSRTIAICDTDLSGPNNYQIMTDADIGHVHDGGTIASFWDGHVELLKPAPRFRSRAFTFTE